MIHVLKARNSKYGRYLELLLNNYQQVEEHDMTSKTVRLNSDVELWLDALQKKVKFKIVLPSEMDIKKRKLSVFSPVCLAVLGREQGDHVETTRTGMTKRYNIINVQN